MKTNSSSIHYLPFSILYLLSSILFLISSCSKDEIDYETSRTSYFVNTTSTYLTDSTLTCITFNIQLGFPIFRDPWSKDSIGADSNQVKAICQILKMKNPDIVALQEVPLNRSNAVIKRFLEAIAKEMKMNYAFGSHGYNDPYGIYPVYGEWGTAILSKFKITNINTVQVEYISTWEKRSLLDATLEIKPNQFIHSISLHYLPSDQGIPNTANYLKTISTPLLLLGDFNYTGEISAFKEWGILDVDSTYMTMVIDRIFYSETDFTPLEFGMVTDSLWWVSDHAANFGKLRLLER
jgi:endonuclease/exonuclease/phosphatase family metal-dependent hydrolase